jgi:hypothetical protein
MGGMTTRRSNASSLMSPPMGLVFFRPEKEAFLGLYLFEVCITRVHRFFGGRCVLGSSLSLYDPEREGYFSKCFTFYSRFLNQPFEVFLAWHLA